MHKLFKLATGILGHHHHHHHQGLSGSDDTLREKFADHVTKYALSFHTKEEYEFRFGVFTAKENEMMAIAEKEPNATYVLEHNRFSTVTQDEFKKYLGKKPNMRSEERNPVKIGGEPTVASIDWREKGAVNPV